MDSYEGSLPSEATSQRQLKTSVDSQVLSLSMQSALEASQSFSVRNWKRLQKQKQVENQLKAKAFLRSDEMNQKQQK